MHVRRLVLQTCEFMCIRTNSKAQAYKWQKPTHTNIIARQSPTFNTNTAMLCLYHTQSPAVCTYTLYREQHSLSDSERPEKHSMCSTISTNTGSAVHTHMIWVCNAEHQKWRKTTAVTWHRLASKRSRIVQVCIKIIESCDRMARSLTACWRQGRLCYVLKGHVSGFQWSRGFHSITGALQEWFAGDSTWSGHVPDKKEGQAKQGISRVQ
jgi:hypothetical protein